MSGGGSQRLVERGATAGDDGLALDGASPRDRLAGWVAGCRRATDGVAVGEVLGDGPLASLLREVLDVGAPGDRGCIVVAGPLSSIDGALADVGPGGVVVVASLAATETITIDAYRHLHRPNATLRFVAAASPGHDEIDRAASALADLGEPEAMWRVEVSDPSPER